MGTRPSKLTFSVLKILVTAQQNKASVVFQLLLDPGHAINSHVARFNMYLCFCCHLFQQNMEENNLYFRYLQKHKKIPFVPQDCPLLNK